MSIADNIKRIRKEKGFTQKKLGELCETSEAMIRQYELGLRNPKIKTLMKIANALHVFYGDLLDNEIIIDNITADLFPKYPALKNTLSNKCIDHYMENLTIEEFETLLSGSDDEIAAVLNKRFRKIVLDGTYGVILSEIYDDEICENLKTRETDRISKINTLFFELNDEGQEEILRYIELLAEMSEYQKED